jgi:Flp pilus assembly protein TadD
MWGGSIVRMRDASGEKAKNGAPPRSSRAHGIRGVQPLGIAALIAAVTLSGLLSFTPELDNDIWWHLATGKRILSGAGIPKADPFTYTALGRPWITHEWLSEVLFVLLDRMGGIRLLVVFKALLAGLAVGLSAWAGTVGRSARERVAGAAIGALLAAPLIAPRAFVRPHMLTALFLGALLLLLRLESDSGRRIWRYLLAPLFLIWANVHSGFVLGFALLVLYWAGEAISGKTGGERPAVAPAWRDRALALGICLAASLVNPHLLRAHLYPFHLVSSEEVRGGIVELRSLLHPAYRGAFFLKGLMAAAMVGLLLIYDSRKRPNWALLLPGSLFALLAVASVRGLSEFSVVLPATLAAHATGLGRRRRMGSIACVGVILLAVAGGAAALVRGMPMGGGSVQKIGLTMEPGSRPVAAARFLREERPTGNIFNLLSYGGYLINELGPEVKVYIDGRLDVFPPGFLKAYSRMLETGEGWDDAVDRYGITIAVLNHVPHPERDRGLRARLRNDPDWTCVLAGDYALVYARRGPANEGILRRYAIPFDPSARHEDFIGAFTARAGSGEITSALAALDAMHRIAPEEIAPSLLSGQILDRVGRSGEATVHARRALHLDPESVPLRRFLAGTLARADSVGAARREFATVLARAPDDVEALSQLAMLERSDGHPDEARSLLEKAVSLNPADAMVHVQLGVVLAESGRIDEGRRHIERALALRPGDPMAIWNLQALEAIAARRGGGALR